VECHLDPLFFPDYFKPGLGYPRPASHALVRRAGLELGSFLVPLASLVALLTWRDLFFRAKHLFIAAILAGPPASHPISHVLFHGGSVCVRGAGRCASG